MSEPNSPGESRRGAPRFFVGCEDDESEVLEDSMRTDMELYEDDEDTDSVGDRCPDLLTLLCLAPHILTSAEGVQLTPVT